MADRRPLATPFAAVPDVDPDTVRHFVKQDAPRETNGQVETTVERPAPARPPQAAESKQSQDRWVPPPRTKKKRAAGIQPVAPVPVTVRLRPEIAGGLKRASLERQLAGEELFTQQDLVETLIEPWLREQGYLE